MVWYAGRDRDGSVYALKRPSSGRHLTKTRFLLARRSCLVCGPCGPASRLAGKVSISGRGKDRLVCRKGNLRSLAEQDRLTRLLRVVFRYRRVYPSAPGAERAPFGRCAAGSERICTPRADEVAEAARARVSAPAGVLFKEDLVVCWNDGSTLEYFYYETHPNLRSREWESWKPRIDSRHCFQRRQAIQSHRGTRRLPSRRIAGVVGSLGGTGLRARYPLISRQVGNLGIVRLKIILRWFIAGARASPAAPPFSKGAPFGTMRC